MDSATYIERLRDRMGGRGLVFERSEYEARIARTRLAMAEERLERLLVTHPPDLNYLTGYDTFGVANHACLVLPLEGQPVLQVMSVEVPAAVVNTWVPEVVATQWYRPGGAADHLLGVLGERGLASGPIGYQPRRTGLRADVAGALIEGLGGSARLVDVSDLVARLRLLKSPAELECLRRAAGYTRAGIEAALAVIRPGATDTDLARAGYGAMLEAGSDFLTIQPIVTTGARTSCGHQTHRGMRIAPGDPVFLSHPR